MIGSIFYFACGKQIEVRFKRKNINFAGDMQSFYCQNSFFR